MTHFLITQNEFHLKNKMINFCWWPQQKLKGKFRSASSPYARSSGLTFLELLVVISIILFLVSLMLACIQTVRHAAQGAACLNNLRQMGMGMFSYAQDEQGRLPIFTTRTFAEFLAHKPGYNNYPLVVAAHFLVEVRGGAANNDVRNVLICPADRRKPAGPGPATWGGNQFLGGAWCGNADKYVGDLVWFNTSYCYGGMFSRDRYWYDPVPVHLGSVNPSSAMFWDSPQLECDSKAIACDLLGINLHRTGVNMGLADGSAKYFDFSPARHGEIWQFAGSLNEVWDWWGTPRHMLGANVGCKWFDNHGQGEPWN